MLDKRLVIALMAVYFIPVYMIIVSIKERKIHKAAIINGMIIRGRVIDFEKIGSYRLFYKMPVLEFQYNEETYYLHLQGPNLANKPMIGDYVDALFYVKYPKHIFPLDLDPDKWFYNRIIFLSVFCFIFALLFIFF